MQARDPLHPFYMLSEMLCTPPRLRGPHSGDPTRSPDHRLRDGLSTCRHLDALFPLLPPGIGQDVVFVRTQLEGVRDLHGCYQIRTENLHREKQTRNRVNGSGRGCVHGEGALGNRSPRDSAVGPCIPMGVTLRCHLPSEVWAGFGENNVLQARQCQEPKPHSCHPLLDPPAQADVESSCRVQAWPKQKIVLN